MMRGSLVLAVAGCVALSQTVVASEAPALRVEGTEWVLQTAGGSRLRSTDLAGAQLRMQGGVLLRIDSVQNMRDPSGRQWWAHELSVRTHGDGWRPLCKPHIDGTHYAIVLPGRQTEDGHLSDDPRGFAISCTSGALAKCLRLGYEPSSVTPAGESMRATHNACVRMMRADYTGRGTPHTVDGRQIDVKDVHGIQLSNDSTKHAFEAGWDEHGAVCVHHVRVAHKVTLEALEAAAPRLRGNLGETCTEARALELGALVFNRSSPMTVADD